MNEQMERDESRPATQGDAQRAALDGRWLLRPIYSKWQMAALMLVLLFLGWSGRHVEMDKAVVLTGQAVGEAVGLAEDSQVLSGLQSFAAQAWPPVIEQVTPVNRLEAFDRDQLPVFSRLDVRENTEKRFDAKSMQWIEDATRTEYLIEPVGYLGRVLWLMIQTIEMALWGTLISVTMAIPLAILGAKNYTPWWGAYHLSRGLCSFFRAIPELVAALFFVLMYGFGPIAGIISLGIHTSGFLGKFFADDIENADPGPQTALRSMGANRLKVLRLAVLPQIMPQCLAYVQYILERNVRTATVLGIVGAGGIGLELKGRWDMFAYGHVTTILIVIFLTVYALEHATQLMRKRLIE